MDISNNNNNSNHDSNSSNGNTINKINDNNNNNNNTNNNITQQNKKPRCHECHKKLSLAQQFECKCGLMFCSMHRYADSHNCTFDYQTIQQKKLESSNPVVAPSKVQQL